MVFRFFYLQKERTHLRKVLKLLGKYTTTEEGRAALKMLGRQWDDCLFAKAMNVEWNNKKLTSAMLLDLWFNAYYFHQDDNKEKELKELVGVFSEGFAKYMLLDAAFEAAKVVYRVYVGVRGIVEEHFFDTTQG